MLMMGLQLQDRIDDGKTTAETWNHEIMIEAGGKPFITTIYSTKLHNMGINRTGIPPYQLKVPDFKFDAKSAQNNKTKERPKEDNAFIPYRDIISLLTITK